MAELLSSPSLAPRQVAFAAREAPGRPARAAPIHRYLLMLLCLLATPGLLFAQESLLSKEHQAGPFVISVQVNMVVLHASVIDRKGLPISGLDKENFQVFEQGARQKVTQFSKEDIPVTVGLVIDNSGSMLTKRSDVIAAALAFARSSNPLDQMFVVNFNEKVSLALPANLPFTDNVAQLEAALTGVRTIGQTALYDAVDVALAHLSKGERDKKVLIIISDGGDNASRHTLDAVLAEAKRSEGIIYTIGLFDAQDEDRNPGVLRRFAQETGGETFLPEAVTDVVPICERIARDIRSQYTLAYVPSNPADDGKYRTVEVRVDAPGRGRLVVRTRSGYFASSAPPALDGVGREAR